MPAYRYGVLGAGRQGTAAAYDLVARGEAASVIVADADAGRAAAAAERVNRLTDGDAARPALLDASDERAVRAMLEPLDAIVSALPYAYNLGIAEAAVDTGTHHCDLGGNTPIVLRELELDERAKAAGVAVVPDCGEAPGMANNLIVYAMGLLDRPQDVLMLDGGIPLEPVPPWNYEVTFMMDGLINEYDGACTWIVDGELVEIACLDPGHEELIDFGPPFGMLEALIANTGSTTTRTIGKDLRSLRFKILRWPGHGAQFRAFRDLGLYSREPFDVRGTRVIPREVLLEMLEPQIGTRPGTRDVVICRIVAKGDKGGSPATATVDVFVYPDDETGFNAMERSTGWHAAIVCHGMASGRIAPGATPNELAVDAPALIPELTRRGFLFTEKVE
ncbi:MAG: saccharopine dehydrogenase family protein [Actinomycetota bacterium]